MERVAVTSFGIYHYAFGIEKPAIKLGIPPGGGTRICQYSCQIDAQPVAGLSPVHVRLHNQGIRCNRAWDSGDDPGMRTLRLLGKPKQLSPEQRAEAY